MKAGNFRRRMRQCAWTRRTTIAGGPAGGGGAGNSAFVRHRIRSRYFKARFADVALPPEGSRDPTGMIKAARLYLEDGESARATELLQIVAEMMPDQVRVPLAKLEIDFRRHDAGAFAATARLVAERFPGCEAWPDVVRLGRRLAPEEPLFADAATGGGQEAATGEADTPNWLEAPPDSAADAAAGEFRRRVLSTSPFAEAAKWR